MVAYLDSLKNFQAIYCRFEKNLYAFWHTYDIHITLKQKCQWDQTANRIIGSCWFISGEPLKRIVLGLAVLMPNHSFNRGMLSYIHRPTFTAKALTKAEEVPIK